jgi:hypothetical protein
MENILFQINTSTRLTVYEILQQNNLIHQNPKALKTYTNLFLRSEEIKIFSNITSFSPFTSSSLFTYGSYWHRPIHDIEEGACEYVRRLKWLMFCELAETLWCVTALLQQVSHSLRKIKYKQLLYIIFITSKIIIYTTV